MEMVYKYLRAEFVSEAIKANKIKLTALREVNDPYEFIGFLSDGGILDLLKVSDFYSNYLIACFSENYSNPVMWAHYAENHSGVVLGYKPSVNLIKVKYEKEQPNYKDIKSRYVNSDKILDHIDKVSSIKNKHWEYEEEVRCIFEKTTSKKITKSCRGIYFLNLNSSEPDFELKEVIFGINFDKAKHAEKIIGLLKGKNIKIYDAKKSTNSFEILKFEYMN